MPAIRRTASSVPAIVLALLASSLLAVGCGSDSAAKDKGGDDTKAVDTTEEPVAPDDQPDPDAEVVPGSGIAGVKVGDSADDVERVLGKAESSDPASTNELSGQSEQRLHFRDGKVDVLLAEDEVAQVETTQAESQTDTGVGIGSSKEDVVKAYPKATCDETGEIRICRVGEGGSGSVSTDFFVEGGKVSRIVVGRVLD